jgi:hypothetical protein
MSMGTVGAGTGSRTIEATGSWARVSLLQPLTECSWHLGSILISRFQVCQIFLDTT